MAAPTQGLPLALTLGDPAGIGPELALRAWAAREHIETPFFLLGDVALMAPISRRLGLPTPVEIGAPAQTAACFNTALPVVALRNPASDAEPGKPSSRFAAASLESIERAVAYIHSGEAGAIVTNPVAKHILYEAGFFHPGQTEFLGDLARLWGAPAQPVMMLLSEALAVVPVTVHIPLRDVPQKLTNALIVSTARIVVRDLKTRFGIAQPRLAVAGLNPHAGEAGALGREEIDLIIPAIASLRGEGLNIIGPLSADTMFHAAARARYDVGLTMYHDQGLIPIKTLSFDTGVNCTLGLPFVRCSPDHGTAFDIAGKDCANPSSLIAALRLAGRLSAMTPN